MALSDSPYADAVGGLDTLFLYPHLRVGYATLGGRTVRRVCTRCGKEARHYPVKLADSATWLCVWCGKQAELSGGREA